MNNIRDSEKNRQPRHGPCPKHVEGYRHEPSPKHVEGHRHEASPKHVEGHRHETNRYIWLVILGAVFIIAICSIPIRAVYDYKSKKSIENNFLPAQITIAVQENDNGNTDSIYISPKAEADGSITWNENSGTYVADKKVTVINRNVEGENNTDAYVRVSIIPRWVQHIYVDSSGQVYTDPTAIAGGTATDDTSTGNTSTDDTSTDDTSTDDTSTGGTSTGDTSTGGTSTAYTTQDIDIMSANYTSFGSLTDVVIKKDMTFTVNGEEVTRDVFVMGDVTFVLNEDWDQYWIFNKQDGYFYYKKLLPAADASTDSSQETGITQPLLEMVSISDDTYNKLATDNVYLRVDILADAIQTEGDALAQRWSASDIVIDSTTGELKLSSE